MLVAAFPHLQNAEFVVICMRSLLEHGFSLLHVRDEFVRAPLLGPEFDGALPPFEEITAENLAFDLEDAKKVPCLAPCMLTKRGVHSISLQVALSPQSCLIGALGLQQTIKASTPSPPC